MIASGSFKAKELVSKIVYSVWGENSLMFFRPETLRDLDLIRVRWGSGITINDWSTGGQYSESGLRSNMDSLVKDKNVLYLSGHCLAIAFDLKPVNGKINEFHDFLWKLMVTGQLKVFKRLEDRKKTPTWGHVDGLQTHDNKPEEFTL